MRAYIKGIAVFNNNGERKEVELSPGLNIISGDSQTGKSALLEIIDYCLGSSNFTVPAGEITDFAKLYAIILCLEDRCILIGRRGKEQSSKLFLKPINGSKRIKEIELKDFEDGLFRPKNEVLQVLTNNYLKINVNDTSEETDIDKKGARGSIRNMVSFLFQHQNLVASKFALFYRFDDPYKKKGTIKQFPVFAGWVDQGYYTTLVRIDRLKNELTKLQKDVVLNQQLSSRMENDLRSAFKLYYNLIGKDFNTQWTISDLEEQLQLFPTFKTPLQVQEPVFAQYEVMKSRLNELRKEDTHLRLKISKLKESEQYGGAYGQMLNSLKTTVKEQTALESYDCPICGKHDEELNQEALKLIEANNWLDQELEVVPKHVKNFAVEIEALESKRLTIKEELKTLNVEIGKIEELSTQIREGAQLEGKKLEAQKAVEVEFRYLKGRIKNIDTGKVNEIEEQLKLELESLSTYDVKNKYREAQVLIQDRMNSIVDKLGFEFRPPKLRFDLEPDSPEVFSLYHNDDIRKRKIYLGQMGSGSNWLACHLGLFLSFLNYFSVTSTSKVPTFLFLDQPSQVFFPKGQSQANDKGYERVANVYKAIIDEIDAIEEEVGFKPQVIVADQIKSLEPHLILPADYFKTEWSEGKGFI